MPVYRHNGDVYDIPQDKAREFESQFPEATVEMYSGDDVYDIPVSKQTEFLSQFSDARYSAPSAPSADEIAEEMQPQGAESKQSRKTSLFGPPPAPMKAREEDSLPQYDEAAREQMRQHLEDSGTIERMEEMEREAKKARNKARREAGRYALIAAEGFAPAGTSEAVLNAQSEARQNAVVAETLDKALDKARAGEWGGLGEDNVGNEVADFGLGLWDSATRASTWDFGVSDALNGLTIAQVVKKWEEDPESLTATERNMLDAMGMATAVQEAYQDKVSVGYAVGESLPVSAGFMASMALNPASGMGKNLARQAVKKYGRQSIAKNLARIGGDIAETAIMTATTGGGRVAADALERINGQSTYEIDPETGIVMYGGQEDQKTVGEAVVKAIGSNFIENYSEALGEYFDPLLGMSRRLAAGGLRKMNLDKWADALSDMQTSQMAASIRSLREKAKFGGVFGEIMEEEVGMALNAITVGDYTFSKEEADASKGKKQWIFDLENQLTTAISCAIMSGAITGVETIGNVRYRREMERSVADAEKAARAAVGDEMIAQIDQASPEGMVDILRDAYMDQSLSLQQKRTLAEYATQRVRMQYYNAADAKARRQVNVAQQNTIDAYEAGRHAQLPQYYNINQEYRRSEAAINERENAEEIWDAIRLMNNMDESERQNIMRDFSEEDQELIRNWRYNAMRWQGAINHRAEQVEDLVDEYAGQVNPYTRPDGTVTTAVLGDNVVYVMNEAENGDAVVYTNDGRKIFCKMRDLEHVQQHNAEELIERFRQQTTQAVEAETEKNLNYPIEVQEPAQGVTVETLDGKRWEVVSTDGENVQLAEMIYDKKSGQWLTNAFDGAGRKMTREQFMDWQKAELDRKKANTYEQGEELTFYVGGEPISAEITGFTPDGDYNVKISHLADGLDKAVSDVYTAEELRKLTTTSSKVSEKTTENDSTPSEEIKQSVSKEVTNGQIEENVPTAEVAESVNTALGRVPKDAKGNPLYEKTDADTAWDAIVEETEGDTEMAQRVAVDMLADKKAALVKLQNGKPKKGATVAEKIANEKAHQAAIAQAQSDVAQWEAIVGTEARRREAAMSEAERYAAEMEQKNISEGLKALGEPQSLQEYVLAQLAGGAYKLRWNDKENGTKGFGSHTGLSTEEMKARLSMVDNKNGLTPEEIAHSIVENMDASFGEVDVMDITDMVIDAVSTYASRRAMLNGMVESRAELLRQQERAEQEAKDAWYMEQYHATEEELAAYNEWLNEETQEFLADEEEYERRIINFAEQLADYDNEGTDASLLRAAAQREGNGPVAEGSSSVGEAERTDNSREVLGNVEGAAAEDDGAVDEGVLAQSDVNLTRETLENGDVRITNRNSNGEIATVAIERDGNVISVDTYEDGALFERTDYDANGNATKVSRYEDGEVVSEQEYKDGKRKVTANYFEMAEEAQKKRKEKKNVRDIQEKEKGEVEGERGDRPRLGKVSFSEFTELVQRLIEKAYRGVAPTEEVARIIREHNNGKTLLAHNANEQKLLKALRVMSNEHIDGLLKEIQEALQSGEIKDAEDRKAYEDAAALIDRFKKRGERKAIVEALTGANLGEKLPLSKIDELFKMYNSDADVAELYRRVRAIAEQIGLDIWFEEGMGNQLGGYLHMDNRVRLNAHILYSPYISQQAKASSILHEMLHAVVGYAVKTQKDVKMGLTPVVKLSKQVLNAANTIAKIYEKAVKDNPLLVHEQFNPDTNEMEMVADYGTTSVEEMLVEISNPEFRDKLKQIEYNGRSVWQRIWDALKSMFTQSSDVTNPTAYDSMAKALDVLINEFSVDAYQKYSGLEESAMKLSAEENLRFREADNQDAAYMDAVERGDMETAQRMVDEVLENAGYTIRGEHGTTHKFTIFNNINANIENSFGKGFYFTSDAYDAEQNYSHDEGPDLKNRIELLAERMEFEDAYEDMDYDERLEEARKRLSGGENIVISAAIRMENPCVFSVDPDGVYKETVFDVEEEYDEENDEYGEPTGLLVDFVNALNEVLAEGDYWGADRIDASELIYDGYYSADQLKRKVDEMLMDITDEEGNLASSEIFRSALERMGFDGIIDNAPSLRFKNMGLSRDTKHYIAFSPNQIKQSDAVTYDNEGNIIPLSERANRANDDIRFRDGAPFFSNAERAVENIKQQKATPEQWLAMIKKDGGLKAGEDKWMGLSDWLNEQKTQGVKTLTKDEVLAYIRENQIEIEEVEYGDSGVMFEWADNLEGEYAESKNYPQARIYMYTNEAYYNGEPVGTFDTFDEAEDALAEKITGQKYRNSTRMDYSTSGLKNNKEIAFVVPSIEPWNQTDTIHFGDAGDGRAVAWVRFGETTDEDGNRVLVIDEVQSKRHDEGRAKGYRNSRIREITKRLNELSTIGYRDGLTEDQLNEKEALEQERRDIIISINPLIAEKAKKLKNESKELSHDAFEDLESDIIAASFKLLKGVPDAPFDKNYHELAMKRMLRYAAENGFDKVAWNTGKQVAQRFGLSSRVSSIEYKPLANGHYHITAYGTNGYPIVGVPVVYNNEQEIAETFGRGVAEKIVNDIEESKKTLKETNDALRELKERRKGLDEDSEEYGEIMEEYARLFALQDEANSTKSIEGDGLSIGGDDRVALYDEMIPRFMNKYTKKWGTKVGEVTLPNVEEAGRTMWSVDVTPEMRESVMQGQPMFREGMGAISDREVSYENDPIAKFDGKPRYYGKRAAAFAERERRRMENAAKEAAEMLGIEAEIITDASTLKGRKAKAKGWYDINSKKVVVVVPNHVSKGDAVRTVLHEGVAHHGLRELFGAGFDNMLDNVYNNVDPELKARIDAIAERTGVDTRVATEEYLARLSEDGEFEYAQKRGWWYEIKRFFLDMFRNLGLKDAKVGVLTDNELRFILWRSYKNLTEPNYYAKPLGYLDDVAKQKELKVGNYAENTIATPRAAEMSEAEEWAAITMQRIEELEAQAAQLENEIADMEADRDADDASRYVVWEQQIDPLRKQLEDVYAEIEGLYSLEAEEDNTRYRFIGEKGAENLDRYEEATTRLDNLKVAKEMEASNKDAKTIKMATGWERGADGKWRYEVEDTFNLERVKAQIAEGLKDSPKTWGVVYRDELGDVVKQYPDFNVDIMVWVGEEYNNEGSYSPAVEGDEQFYGRSPEIHVYAKTIDDIDRLLAHEIQHYVQEREGFASGGTTTGLRDKLSAELNNVVARAQRLRNQGKNEEADALVKKSRGLAEAVINNEEDIFGNYKKLSGEVEARNAATRMGMSMEERRASLAYETEDVAREDQIFLFDAVESAMGSRVDKRMADVAQHFVGAELSEKQRAIVDVFGGVRNNLSISIERADGSTRRVVMRQGREDRGGTRHSLLRHYGTSIGNYTADELLLVEDVLANGEFTETQRRGVTVNEYQYEIDGVRYIVVTEKKDGREEFANFYTNRSGDTRSLNTQLSARAGHTTVSSDRKVSDNSSSMQENEGDIRNSEEIISEVEREAAALGVPVRIVRSVDELPDEDTRKRAVDGKLKGYFDPRTGEVALYEPNTDDANDAKRTILHETVGHKGLRQLIGEERYDKAMVQLMYMLPSEVRDAVLRRAERHGWNAAIAMDEYLAEQAERDVQPTWWGKVNAKIRALLRNIGFNVMLTDADVTYLLWRSRKKLMGDTAFDMATDAILKQAARNSAEADAWNEQAFKDAEMRNFEKGAMQRLRNRIGDAQNEYDSAMKSMAFKQRESWQDSMRSLKVFMDIVSKESGKKIADWENAYMYENAMSSANLMEMQMFRHDVYGRLLKAINELMESGAKYEEVVDYMMAKHGLERNEKMARKRAEKEAEGDAIKEAELYDKYRKEDLSGLTALTGVDNVADAEAAAMQMIADFEAKHNTDLLWNETRACTQTILNISHDAGILSDKVYDELWNQYEYYIPLRGFDETTAEEVYTYVGDNKSPYNAPIKTAKGRKSKADDPIATIATMAESAIVEANRNRLKQRFLYMVERHRTELASVSSVWVEKDPITGDCVARFANIPNDATPEEAAQEQKAFEERMEQLHEQEPERYYKASEKPNIPYRVEKKPNEHEHQVIVKRGGKDVVITINGDPRVAQAINGLTNPEAAKGFDKFAGNVNRFLSANFTTRNPAFVASNFVRDGFYTNSMVWAKESPAYAWKYNQNWVKATKLLPSLVNKYKRYEKGDKSALDMSDPIERAFYEFMINGGETGYTVINSVEDYKGIVDGDLKTMQGGVVGNTKKAVKAVGEVLDTFGRWAEDTSRFAAFLTSREMGRSVTKSIWDAKEISVNFNKKGSGRKMTQHDKGLNSILGWMSQQGRNLYVFWNAGMQGLYNFGKAVKEHPGKMAGLAGVYFGLGMAIAAIFGGHDDDEDYLNLPEYVRRNNICFRVGDKFVTLPLPIELRAIYGMGELAMSWMAGKEDPKKVGMKVVQQMSQVMPIDMMAEGGGLMAFVPSWAKPIVEVGVNTDWTGMPIYRERTPWNEYDPQWMLAFKSTSPELVAASRAINEATNKNLPSGKENKYDRGWADIEYLNNPAAWEHIAEGYLGGLATMFNQTKKSAMAIWNKDLREVRNIPVVSRFVKDAGEKSEEYALREDYFNAKGVVDELRSQRGHFRKESIDPSLTEEQRKDVMESRVEMEKMVNATISQWNNLENARKKLEDMVKDNPDQEVTFDGKKGNAKDALDEVTRRMVKLTEGYQ